MLLKENNPEENTTEHKPSMHATKNQPLDAYQPSLTSPLPLLGKTDQHSAYVQRYRPHTPPIYIYLKTVSIIRLHSKANDTFCHMR